MANLYLTDQMWDFLDELITKYETEIDNYDINTEITESTPKWLWNMAYEFLNEIDFNTKSDELVWAINRAQKPEHNNVFPTNLIFCSSLRPKINEKFNVPPKVPYTLLKVLEIVGSEECGYVMKIILDILLTE